MVNGAACTVQGFITSAWQTRYGYIEIYAPDHPNTQSSTGWALEHRVVMANLLGRPLRKLESVHHKNGIRNDNRPCNLELWLRAQPTGQRVLDVVAWAEQILSDYRPEIAVLASL